MGLCVGRLSQEGGESIPVHAQLSKGSIVGEARGGVVTYSGVPFAAPPVGPLRWLRPQPAQPWSGFLDCTDARPRDVRRGYPVQDLSEADSAAGKYISEDCLYGNIWAPESATNAPVLVWIYGGSLVSGCAHDAYCSGRAYAERGIVVCTFNYRLGAIGFLSPEGGDQNCGFWDQVAALQWVQKEIHAFGGNRKAVTIMGESSGGDSVFYHCASPASRGLFSQAIIQSPASFPVTKEQARELTQEFAELLGAKSMQRSELQEYTVEEILKVQCGKGFRVYPTIYPAWRLGGEPMPPSSPVPDPTPGGIFRFPVPDKSWEGSYFPMPALVLDGEFMVETPLDALAHGSCDGVKVIIGANREEISPQSWGPTINHGRDEVIQRIMWELAGAPTLLHASPSQLQSKAETIAKAYEAERLADPWGLGRTAYSPSPEQWLCNTIFSDFGHIVCAELIAQRLAVRGKSKGVFRYQFDGYGGKSAHHGWELPLCLGEDVELTKDKQRNGTMEARKLWLDSWAAFVTTGDPNTKEMANAWDQYDCTGRTLMLWDGVIGWRVGAAAGFDRRVGLKATLRLWEELWGLASAR